MVCGEFRAMREYTHTLRLESELSDFRVGYANSAMRAELALPEFAFAAKTVWELAHQA